MNDPHDQNKYTAVDESTPHEPPEQTNSKRKEKHVRKKLSGAYYYTTADNDKLKEAASVRTILTIIAFALQMVTLALPQAGLEYVTLKLPSYAFVYMWVIFIMLGVSIWLFVMNALRYKIAKRVPKEYAPGKGFKRRAYFGTELYIAVNALVFALELSFVCFEFDGWGLAGMFATLLATGAAVWARIVTHRALKDSELIPAPDTKLE